MRDPIQRIYDDLKHLDELIARVGCLGCEGRALWPAPEPAYIPRKGDDLNVRSRTVS